MRSFLSQTLRRLEVTQSSKVHFPMSRSRRWRENTTARKAARALLHSSSTSKMDKNSEEKADYNAWSQEKLIERVTQLEAELKAQNTRFSFTLLLQVHHVDTKMQFDIATLSITRREEIMEEAAQLPGLRSLKIQHPAHSAQARLPRQTLQWFRVPFRPSNCSPHHRGRALESFE